MTKYQVAFSYTVEVETDEGGRDAENTAFRQFEELINENPSANYFIIHDAKEVK